MMVVDRCAVSVCRLGVARRPRRGLAGLQAQKETLGTKTRACHEDGEHECGKDAHGIEYS